MLAANRAGDGMLVPELIVTSGLLPHDHRRSRTFPRTLHVQYESRRFADDHEVFAVDPHRYRLPFTTHDTYESTNYVCLTAQCTCARGFLSLTHSTVSGGLMPGFHHSVAVSPFCRCRIPLFCRNYVRKFRPVTAVKAKNCRNCSSVEIGLGSSSIFPLFRSVAGQPIIDADEPRHKDTQRQRQRLTGTAKRQRKNGNGIVETRH